MSRPDSNKQQTNIDNISVGTWEKENCKAPPTGTETLSDINSSLFKENEKAKSKIRTSQGSKIGTQKCIEILEKSNAKNKLSVEDYRRW